MSFYRALVTFLFVLSACLQAYAQESDLFDEELLKKLPLRKKIGQMFMVGFRGQTLKEGLGASIKAISPGGIIIFGRNISTPKQVAELIYSAQKASLAATGVPLLVATDQEGGNVIRIKTAIALPSPLAIGQAGKPEIAEKAGLATGRLLKTLGINMNLAPVLDVSDPKKLTFVGTRTYGSDPYLVAMMSSHFAAGLMNAGVLATGKHFPGHGGISEDSHLLTPEKNETLDEMMKHDLIPFAKLQERFKNQWAVMLAHVSYPKIDPSGDPATFSKPIVQGILREKLGFDGVVLTDDLSMAGAEKIKDFDERVIRSIEAGADMILVAWNSKWQRSLVQIVERAVRSGRISEKRIDESVQRILRAKKKFATDNKLANPYQLQMAVNSSDLKEVAAATLVSTFSRAIDGDEKELRSYAADRPVLVFSSSPEFTTSFLKGLSKRNNVRTFKLDVGRPHDVNRIMRANPDALGVFYLSGYRIGRIASKIGDDVARRMLLVTVEPPGHLPNIDNFRYVKSVFMRHPALGSLIARRYFREQKRAATLRAPAVATSKK